MTLNPRDSSTVAALPHTQGGTPVDGTAHLLCDVVAVPTACYRKPMRDSDAIKVSATSATGGRYSGNRNSMIFSYEKKSVFFSSQIPLGCKPISFPSNIQQLI